MADDASITLTATVLPDEIAKTISGSMTISPADANDKWYYKLTSVSNSSTDLIAGYFTDYTAVDDDTAPTAVATGDKVNFLFIKNTDSSNDVYVVLDAGTASTSVTDGIKIANVFSVPRRALETTARNVIIPKNVPKTNPDIVSGLFNTLLICFILADPM